jgi:protein-L-isoaspartate(D-aspartate) O-methyltransferase
MDTDRDYRAARDRMVDALVERRQISDPATIDALRSVPRHEFVPEGRRGDAYADRPLPIGEGQTISAPHMVGVMCDLLDLEAGDRVLEIGTGCGYHAAVTAEIVGPGYLYSVEYYEPLAERSRERFERLGYEITVRVGDGHEGWPEHTPYDACYLTCATPEVPDALFDQLDDGGRLLAPVGDRFQTLVLYEDTERGDGEFRREEHGGVRFVPMKGGA